MPNNPPHELTNANRAYQHLRRKLIEGDFQPGTRLKYGPIGQEIGVSATPVREAAGQLANEGLVDLVPQLGAVVRTLSKEDLVEIYEVREIIEPAAAALACQRASDQKLAQIQDAMDEMRSCHARQVSTDEEQGAPVIASKKMRAEFDQADYQFHTLILESTGNQALIRTASQSHILTRVFGIRKHQHNATSMDRTCLDHEVIVAALQRRDPDAAHAASVDHIRHGLKVTIEEYEDAESQQDS